MYDQIEIHKTDFPNKYLFICDNGIFFGGFVIKDIIELSREGLGVGEITRNVSDKYQSRIDQKDVEKIIDEDIPRLIGKTKRTIS
jgi:hypothetical protein